MPLTSLQSGTASSLIQQLLRQLGYDENAVANSGSWSGYNGLEAALAPMVQQLIGGYSDQALQSNMNYDGDLGEYTGLNSAFSGGLLNQLLGTAKSNQTVQGFLSNKPPQDYKRTTTPGGGANGGPIVGPSVSNAASPNFNNLSERQQENYQAIRDQLRLQLQRLYGVNSSAMDVIGRDDYTTRTKAAQYRSTIDQLVNQAMQSATIPSNDYGNAVTSPIVASMLAQLTPQLQQALSGKQPIGPVGHSDIPSGGWPVQPSTSYGSALQSTGTPTNLSAGIGAPTNLSSSNTPIVEDPNVSAPTIIDGVLHIPPSGGSVQTPGTQPNTGGAPVANQNTQPPGDVAGQTPNPIAGLDLSALIDRSYQNAGVNSLLWSNPAFQRQRQYSNDLANIYKLMNPDQYTSDLDLVNKLPSLWGSGVQQMINQAPLGDPFQRAFIKQPDLVNLVSRVLGFGNSGIETLLPSYIQDQLLPDYNAHSIEYNTQGKTTMNMLRQILSGQFSGNLNG